MLLNAKVGTKDFMYQVLGFQCQLSSNEELSYDDIYNSIDLGPFTKRICEQLDIDFCRVQDYIKKYVFHKLSEDALELSESELSLANIYSEEPASGDLTFGDILDRAYISSSNIYKDFITEPFMKHFRKSNGKPLSNEDRVIMDKIVADIYTNNRLADAEGNEYLKKGTSLSRFYFEIAKRYKKPLKKPSGDITKSDFRKLTTNALEFLEILDDCIGDEPATDLLLFEKETNLLFLMKGYADIKKSTIDEKSERSFIKLYSAFSIIDDLDLKNLFVEKYVEENECSPFYKSEFTSPHGFLRMFQIIYVIIPFLGEYVKDKIIGSSDSLPALMKINDQEELNNFRNIKRKLVTYNVMSEISAYSVKNIMAQSSISDIKSILKDINLPSNTTDIFFKLYTATQKLKSLRKSFSEQSIERIISRFEKYGTIDLENSLEFLDIATFEVVEEFMSQLALKSNADDILRSKYEDFDGDFEELVDFFVNGNLDKEKLVGNLEIYFSDDAD